MEEKNLILKNEKESHVTSKSTIFIPNNEVENFSIQDSMAFVELNTKLVNFANIWRQELSTELKHYNAYNDTTRLFMDSVGKQMESIALTCCNYLFGNDESSSFKASGTGGSGYDLINTVTHRGVEVKSCNLVQNVVCSCGSRYNPLLSNKCPTCGSINRLERRDTRFGIDAKETLRQVENGLFDRFMFITVDSLNSDIDNGEVELSLLIDTVDLNEDIECNKFLLDNNTNSIKDIRLDYFRNQLYHGKKAHCNLLPNSFDYYKLCPTRLFEIKVSFNHKLNTEVRPIDTYTKKVNRMLPVPKSILRKNEIALLENARRKNNNILSTDDFAESYDALEFTTVVPYRHKTLGKNRGVTTINKDKSLN